jgi:hypothetical protein
LADPQGLLAQKFPASVEVHHFESDDDSAVERARVAHRRFDHGGISNAEGEVLVGYRGGVDAEFRMQPHHRPRRVSP